MDAHATVTAAPPGRPDTPAIRGDQAVFTSMRTPTGEGYRIVADYIAGMTDRYALDEHKRLYDPYERT